MNDLQDKVCIITGGAGGIGFASAQLYLAHGAKVMLVDLDAAQVEAAVGRLESPNVRGVAADVSSADATRGYVKATVDAFGGVDVLFANAGTEGKVTPLLEYPDDAFAKVLGVNVLGVFFGIRETAPLIAARGGGSIIVTGSVASLVGSPGLSAYVTSKHAVYGLAKTAAMELAASKIRVNVIAPGPIDNRMMRSIEDQASPGHGDQVKAGFLSQVPLGRYGTNEEIAELALFLASARSTYSTGGIFVADGGFAVH